MAAIDTMLPLMRSTRYSAATLRIQLGTLDGVEQCTAHAGTNLKFRQLTRVLAQKPRLSFTIFPLVQFGCDTVATLWMSMQDLQDLAHL